MDASLHDCIITYVLVFIVSENTHVGPVGTGVFLSSLSGGGDGHARRHRLLFLIVVVPGMYPLHIARRSALVKQTKSAILYQGHTAVTPAVRA